MPSFATTVGDLCTAVVAQTCVFLVAASMVYDLQLGCGAPAPLSAVAMLNAKHWCLASLAGIG